MSEPVWTPDTELGAWLHERLARWGTGAGTPVTSLVPGGYEAYARVLHPLDDGDDDGRSTTWAQVCAAVGTTSHPLVQWEAATRTRRTRRSTTSAWDGDVPEVGNLEPRALAAVVEVLSRSTPPGQPCVMALWEGHGWVDGQGAALHGPSGTVRLPPAFPQHVLDGPRLRLPDRDHLLFTGPLEAALQLGRRTPAGLAGLREDAWLWRQSPSLLWPQDRSWCLATEVDLDSTVVGGPAALVEALCADPRLEVWPVPADGDLSSAGDHLNRA